MTDPIFGISQTGGPYNNITISDFTIDGNRDAASAANDLDVKNVRWTGADRTNVSTLLGLRVIGNTFLNSPGSAIAMHPNPVSSVYKPIEGVYISRNRFIGSSRAPIHVSSDVFGEWESKDCDANWPTLDGYDAVTGIPTQIRIEGNYFTRNSTGAFGINGQKVLIKDNLMVDNYDSLSQDCQGGVVAILACSRRVEAEGNFISNVGIGERTNSALPCADSSVTRNLVHGGGFELWGWKTELRNNTLRYLALEGIGAASVRDLTVQGNTVENTSRLAGAIREGGELDLPGFIIFNNITGALAGQTVRMFRQTNGIASSQNQIRNTGSPFAPNAMPWFQAFQSYGIRVRRGFEDIGIVPADEQNHFSGVVITDNLESLTPNRYAPRCQDPEITGVNLPVCAGFATQ